MRYKKKKVRIKWGRFLACILVLCVIIAALVFVPKLFKKPSGNTANNTNNSNNSANTANTANTNNSTPAKKTEVSIRIRCAGDILYHNPVIYSGGQDPSKYDYSEHYALVKKWLEDADLSMVQFETTFNVDETPREYQGGYPTLVFDSPDILAKNVKDAGADIALFANNHMLDSRLPGTKTTVKYLREVGFKAVCGARADTSEPRSQIVEAAGLKIGIVAFTYETDLYEGKRTVNGTPMEDDAPGYINSFRYEEGADGLYHIVSEDLALIKSEMDWCRNQGAEILICYFHRGRGAQEYASQPDNPDIELMKFAAENGADMIFAGHPHVLQPIDVINVEVPYPEGIKGENDKTTWTKTVPVYYSMGNFISNQRYETLKDYAPVKDERARLTEQGIIANVELTYTKETGEIKYTNISAIPTWVEKYNNGARDVYQIVPLLDDLDSVESLKASGHTQRAKDALASITEFLGEKYIYKK